MGDAEIDRLPQIRDRRSKIAAIRLTLAAPHQHEREVEDVSAAASLGRVVEWTPPRRATPPRPTPWPRQSTRTSRSQQVAGTSARPAARLRAGGGPSRYSRSAIATNRCRCRDLLELIQVDLADRCFGDRIGLRVPPRRADQLRQEQLVVVRILLPIDLIERPLEDGKSLRDPAREPEGAAQLERDRAAPRPASARSSRPARRWSAAAGPFVRRSAKPSSTSTSARAAGSICSSSARLRYPTAASAAPWASERSAAWRSVETTKESARGATRRRWPAALSGSMPAWSSSSAAERCAASRSTTSSVS